MPGSRLPQVIAKCKRSARLTDYVVRWRLPTAGLWTLQCGMPRIAVIVLLFAAWPPSAVAAEIPVDGGCVIGASEQAHGLSTEEASARIVQYARRYVQNYASWNRTKIDARRRASDYLELKKWTQDDVVGFTRYQRELLYIRVAGELATGRIDTGDLPGYVAAIDNQILDIEIELGCDVMPAGAE
jgi:hypothetical protein